MHEHDDFYKKHVHEITGSFNIQKKSTWNEKPNWGYEGSS